MLSRYVFEWLESYFELAFELVIRQAKSAVSQEIGAVEKLLDNRKQELMQQIDVTTIEQMTALNVSSFLSALPYFFRRII